MNREIPLQYILLLLLLASACTKYKAEKKEVNLQREEEYQGDDMREKDSYKKNVPIEDQDLDL